MTKQEVRVCMWKRSKQVYFLLLVVAVVVATMIAPMAGPAAGLIGTRTTRCMTPEMRASVPLPGIADEDVINRLLDIQSLLDGVAGAEEARRMAFDLMTDYEAARGIGQHATPGRVDP